jgi:two-component system LytT family response regulator
MAKMRCIIIDDEMLARAIIKKYLSAYRHMEVIAEASDGFEGAHAIQRLRPDVVFLDVQMPKLSGLEMLEIIEEPPYIVFTTAFQEHAVRAFEMNAIDYLLKPFSQERFAQAVDKIDKNAVLLDGQEQKMKTFLQETPYLLAPLQRIVVKTVHAIKVIPVNQIQYVETLDDYVLICTREGKFIKQQTMKYLESMLDPKHFIRIHRSYLINIEEILRIEPGDKMAYTMVMKENIRLPISRSGYSLLKEVLDF